MKKDSLWRKLIQSYLKEKALNQDFEVTRISEFYINVKFDGKYDFSIWIGQYANNCEFWNGSSTTNSPSLFNPEFTDEEKEEFVEEIPNYKEEWDKFAKDSENFTIVPESIKSTNLSVEDKLVG